MVLQPHASKGIKAAQLADHIRDLCARNIQKEIQSGIVTVTAVTLTPDFRRATAWIRTYPTTEAPKVVALLQKRARYFQSLVQKDMQRKVVPMLSFAADTTLEDQDYIQSLLKS